MTSAVCTTLFLPSAGSQPLGLLPVSLFPAAMVMKTQSGAFSQASAALSMLLVRAFQSFCPQSFSHFTCCSKSTAAVYRALRPANWGKAASGSPVTVIFYLDSQGESFAERWARTARGSRSPGTCPARSCHKPHTPGGGCPHSSEGLTSCFPCSTIPQHC